MSATKRDFPATSIGRSQGARIQQGQSVASHEAHPLLGASRLAFSSSSPASSPSHGGPTAGTGTNPSHLSGDTATATSKLQMMHLKAAAQSVGLDTGTLGWIMLERLLDSEGSVGSGGKKEQDEWAEVWSMLTSSKATLLLPLSSHEKIAITPELLRDHIILCDGPGRKNGQFITLSGIRGNLSEYSLTVLTTLPRTSQPFSSLLSLTPTSSGGSTPTVAQLPPLPTPYPHATFPEIDLVSYTASLPLPPRNLHPHATTQKPPLPPRPGPRPTSSGSTTAPPSRIPNPFASLFGSNIRLRLRPYTTPHPLRMQDVAADVVKSIHKAVEGGLEDIPTWVKDRVADFVQEMSPFVKSSKPSLPLREKEKGDKEKHDHELYVPNPFFEPPEEIAGRLQDLYVGLEEELRVWVRENDDATSRSGSEEREDELDEKGNEEDMDEREREFMRLEQRVKDVMEAVEKVICEVFYDRLFMQPTTDDSSHDEALSSRVAALNMLDLTLGHLDIEVPEAAKKGVNGVVAKCGEALSRLVTAHSPAGKAAVLVEAHKIVVDGLSKLPPIRLKSEEEKAASSKAPSVDEFEDDLPTARPFVVTKDVELQVKNTASTEAKDDAANSVSSSTESSFLGGETATSPVENSLLQAPPSPLPLAARSLSPVGDNSVASSPRRHRPTNLSLSSPTHSPLVRNRSLPPDPFADDKPQETTQVSGDVNQGVGGEESYCLINMMAVAEFLENVDLAALGLGDSERVMSTADLTPILLTRSPVTSETPLAPSDANSLRGRMEQQVDAIADSANKVISGVVDSSFGILRSFLPNSTTPTAESAATAVADAATKPGFGLLRRESGFSIASIAASLPIAGRKPQQNGEEAGQQLVTVSRPSSVKSRSRAGSAASALKIHIEGSESGTGESEASASGTDDEEDEDEYDEEDIQDATGAEGKSVRSIRSFESMMSASQRRDKKSEGGNKGSKESTSKGARTKPIPMQRKSLSDRLAHMSQSALAGFKNSPPTLQAGTSVDASSPASSRPSSPAPPSLRLAPPVQRFIDCNPEDLRLGEINELLTDYKRLVEGIRAAHGFVDWD
ncbi:hypothetical protein BDQ17DRAFT_1368587 [Cyathus striatus]|nr:hypothetical protein BDQ17DRAFT_1368587 [Cyathus striatus]